MRIKNKYLLAGVIFGCMFPVGALVFESILTKNVNIIDLHINNKLLFMIDSAPIFLGAFAYVGGVYQEKSTLMNKDLMTSSNEMKLLLNDLEEKSVEMANTQVKTKEINNNLNETLEFVSTYVDNVLEDISEIDVDITEIHDKSSELLIKSDNIKNGSETSFMNHQRGSEIIASMAESVLELDKELKIILNSISIEQKNILALSNNLHEINTLKSRVENVSDEIELLALNAAIEASRVGEAGKGFAVVATEIKKLSLESQSATSDMAAYLEDITLNFQKVSESMTEISDEIHVLDHSIEVTRDNVVIYKKEQKDEMSILKEIQFTSISQVEDVSVLNNAIDCAKSSVTHLKELINENKKFLKEKRS